VGAGYFFVWAVLGMAVFSLGAALAAIAMQQPALARAVPIAAGVVVLIAGALQFSAWKAHHLACCRRGTRELPHGAGRRRHGLATWPAPRTPLQLLLCRSDGGRPVIGVMDLRAMAVAATVITVERLAPAVDRIARSIGAVAGGAGLLLIARAAGLG
jgi:predicted metal-binding membrane protein